MPDAKHEMVESVAAATGQDLVVPAPTLDRWFDFAHTLNGYTLAEELGVDLGELSERLWAGYRGTGRWSGTLLELRMVLFHEARAVHFVGGLEEDPRFLADIAALLNAIAATEDERRKSEAGSLGGGPIVFHASIGGHFGPLFQVEWLRGRLLYQAFAAWREFGLPEGDDPVTRYARPTARRWQRFWAVLDRVDAWAWEPWYELPVMDGTAWTMEFETEGRKLYSRGSNSFPGAEGPEPSPDFRRVCRAISRLVGGLPFR